MKAFSVFGVDVPNIIFDDVAAETENAVETEEDDEEGATEGEDESEAREVNEDVDPSEAESWISSEDAPGLQLPSHIRCAHKLALCATTDVRNELKLNPALEAIHDAVLQRCNALWDRCRRPKSAEIMKGIIGRCLKRPVATRWNSLSTIH